MLPPSFVQANAFASGNTSPASVSVSTLSDTKPGNFLLIFAYGFGIAGTLTDTQGNSYSYNVVSNGGVTEYRVNGCIGGPLTVTLTFSGTPGSAGIAVAEYQNAAVNIGDQLENVAPYGNVTGDFSLCPSSGTLNAYECFTGAGTDLSAVCGWIEWDANTAYGGEDSGDALYVPNNLSPVTLEGATNSGTSGATLPTWVSGGVTDDNGISWQDSGIELPGYSLVTLGVMADQGGAIVVNGSGWIQRAVASSGYLTVAIYDRSLPDLFLTSYTVSVSKTVDTYDLAAQLAHVTGFPGAIPGPAYSGPVFIDDRNLPTFSLPFCCRKDTSCQAFPFR